MIMITIAGRDARPQPEVCQPPLMPEVTAEALRAGCEELICSWDEVPALNARPSHTRHVMILFGLAQHVHDTGRAVLLLQAHQMFTQVAPLVRKSLEFALMTQWLRLNRDAGLTAFIGQSERLHRATIRNMQDVGWSVPQNVLDDLDDADALTTHALSASVKHVEQLCKAVGAPAMYVVYRNLSAYCHPSFAAAAEHVDLETMALGRSRSDRHPDQERTALWTTAASLLWSGRALDEFVRYKPRKGELRTMGRRLGIPDLLPGPGQSR